MSKDPFDFYPWYVKDFHVSTNGWDRHQKGLYRELLDYQWTQGRIPDDEKLIMKIGGFKNNGTFHRSWEIVKKKFPNGINPRLDFEKKKAIKSYKQKVAGGRKGAHRRYINDLDGKKDPRLPKGDPKVTHKDTSRSPIGINNNINNNNKKKKEYSPTSKIVVLSKLLLKLIQERDPDHKEPPWDTWYTEMDRLNRLDKRPWPEIEKVIRWCQKDKFWKNNILSVPTLRRQYGQLKLKMEANDGQQYGIVEDAGYGLRD